MHRKSRWRGATTAAFALLAVSGCAGEPVATQTETSAVGGITPPSESAGASSAPGTTSPSAASRSAASAQDAARGYYAALAAHDVAAARTYLSPSYLASFGGESAFAAWVANYRSITNVSVRAPQAPAPDAAGHHPGYQRLTVIPVSYTARLRSPSANEVDGALDRFVLVGRSGASGPWQILDIATSP